MSLAIRKNTSPSLGLSFDQMLKMAEMIAKSDLAPKDYKNRPENCLIAIQMGQEVGLQPMQAIQNIAVINGRPAIWGDAALGLVLASSACEDVIETAIQDGKGYSCIAKRKGHEPRKYEFTIELAKQAGLWGKTGPWTQYPQRMLQMRARGFALRDKFADVLKGLILAEEAMDIPPEKIINPTPESVNDNQSQVSKLKSKLNIEKKESEEKPVKVSEEWLANALAELNNINSIDELIEECKELAAQIKDVEQRKMLEARFKERKTHIEEIEKIKQELGDVEQG